MPPKNPKSEYIETDTGNKVSRKAHIHGTQNIILGGKSAIQSDCTLRGDLHRLLPPSTTAPSTTQSGAKPAKPQSTPAVSMGRYCILCPGSLLRPPSKSHRLAYSIPGTGAKDSQPAAPASSSNLAPPPSTSPPPATGAGAPGSLAYSYHPLHLSSHIHMGPETVCEAASIGSHVVIGARCVIGKFVIIKDHVRVLDGSVLPQGMVVPSFSVVGGRPARVVAEIGEGGVGRSGDDSREEYRSVR
ncbi:MAG: Mannose-6-phosphate isomerase [Chaenotheca gracillima]|nr:MAG: Mannose-6-phosphate isomerase [Chaenotheca gracillima]